MSKVKVKSPYFLCGKYSSTYISITAHTIPEVSVNMTDFGG